MNRLTVVKGRSLGRIAFFAAALLALSCKPGMGLDDLTSSKSDSHYLHNYRFSKDTLFSSRIPLWEKTLGHLRGRPGINYLEIGVLEGRSALWMLENILTDPTAKMTCIDIFPGQLREKFLANLRMSGSYEKATVIKGRSQVELRYLPLNYFDIVYIDGSHLAQNVLSDAVLSWELLKTGGIMIFDDYKFKKLPPEVRPRIAIDSFVNAFNSDVEIIHRGYQVILKKLPHKVPPNAGS